MNLKKKTISILKTISDTSKSVIRRLTRKQKKKTSKKTKKSKTLKKIKRKVKKGGDRSDEREAARLARENMPSVMPESASVPQGINQYGSMIDDAPDFGTD
jgi:hypothetical protein